MNRYVKFFLALLIGAAVFFKLHEFVLSSLGVQEEWGKTDYSLFGLYLFNFTASLVVCLLIFLVYWSMPKNVGFVFLGLVVLKMFISYLYVKDGLGRVENDFIEYNFLATFFMFLLFDVYVAFSAVNQGDVKVENKV